MQRPLHGNHILSELSSRDYALLESDFEQVDLPLRKQLVGRGRRIDYVYFMDSGIASVVAGNAKPVEVGIIGREGFSPVNVIMGAERSYYEVFMQVAGAGRRIRADILREADERSVTLHRVLQRYVHALLLQVSQTAQANSSLKIDERLARWLLLCADRVEDDVVPMTHQFLSLMLGTPRPGTTVAVQQLVKEGLITNERGLTTILDRKALEERCHGVYEALAETI
jgi:CRP-like cAMP-binding protein